MDTAGRGSGEASATKRVGRGGHGSALHRDSGGGLRTPAFVKTL